MRKLTILAVLMLPQSAVAGNIDPTSAVVRSTSYHGPTGPPAVSVGAVDPLGPLFLNDSRDPRTEIGIARDAAVLFPTADIPDDSPKSIRISVSSASANQDPTRQGEMSLYVLAFVSGPTLDESSFASPAFWGTVISVTTGSHAPPLQFDVALTADAPFGDWIGVRMSLDEATLNGPNDMAISGITLSSIPEPSSSILAGIAVVGVVAYRFRRSLLRG